MKYMKFYYYSTFFSSSSSSSSYSHESISIDLLSKFPMSSIYDTETTIPAKFGNEREWERDL